MKALRVVSLSTCAIFAFAQDVDAIIARHLQARGGVERIKATQTLRILGRSPLLPAIEELPIKLERKRPNKFRVELTVRGMVEVDVFDGKEGWMLTPWSADKSARPMKQEQVEALKEDDFDGPLVDWKEKGFQVSYLDRARVDGAECHRIRVIHKQGLETLHAIDAKTFQEIQREKVIRDLGNEWRLTSTFDDFRKVNGLMIPFWIEHRANNRGYRQRIYVDRAEVDATLDETRFAKPQLKIP
jgi:outer membrane lipoprotein-sorting protein